MLQVTLNGENAGIDDGDYVRINANSLDCANPATQDNLAILEGRGVNLTHDC